MQIYAKYVRARKMRPPTMQQPSPNGRRNGTARQREWRKIEIASKIYIYIWKYIWCIHIVKEEASEAGLPSTVDHVDRYRIFVGRRWCWLSRSLIALHFIHDSRLSVSVSSSARMYNYNAASHTLYMSKDVLIILFLANMFSSPSLHRLRLNLLLDHIMHVSERARQFANTASKWTIRWWILRFVDLCPSLFFVPLPLIVIVVDACLSPDQNNTIYERGARQQQQWKKISTVNCIIELKHLRFIYLN